MKTALITGGHKGLGLGWSHTLAKHNYQVIIASRSLEAAQEAAKELKSKGHHAHAISIDVGDENSIAKAQQQVASSFESLDLLINNAGVNPKDYTDKNRMAKAFNLDQLDFEEMEKVYRVNSLGPLIMVKHFKPLLLKAPKPMVLNISSWLGSVTNMSFGGHYGYVSSKNLLNVLNKSMALEIKDQGIICINVNPGWVKTHMGGQKATFTPEQSAENVYQNVLSQVTLEDTGKFFNFDGQIHPW
jgi:NAD(P)-dependent dehydrogenase (short-subunit alcohol dehydrogenase family)